MCIKPFCTTCGCLEFKRACWSAAARQAGTNGKIDLARHHRDLLTGFSKAEREAVIHTLIAGMRQVRSGWSNSVAMRAIIIDLSFQLERYGLSMNLSAALFATPAGNELASMEAHARWVSEEDARRKAYESPQAVEERRRLKREARASAHALRQAETRKRNADRRELIAVLAGLSVAARISRIAMEQAINLDSVPVELIATQDAELIELTTPHAIALVTRIGRRKGAWGRLRRMILRRLEANPG